MGDVLSKRSVFLKLEDPEGDAHSRLFLHDTSVQCVYVSRQLDRAFSKSDPCFLQAATH